MRKTDPHALSATDAIRIGRSKPRAAAVAEALRELVHARRLVPGDKLPSEAELGEMLGVGRSSIREGVQLLHSLGLIEVEQGRGSFLAWDMGGGLGRVVDWVYGPEDRERLAEDLMDARVVVEVALAQLASVRATDDELRALMAQRGEADAGSAATAVQVESLGRRFHEDLARIAHNDVLLVLANALEALYGSLVAGLERSPDDLLRTLSGHSKIIDAIVARDSVAAGEAMAEHVDEIRELVRRGLADADAAAPARRRRSRSGGDGSHASRKKFSDRRS